MIKANLLSRRFGTTLAIDELSFEIAGGEIVGLLGLNGAGKSTTMRILSGALAPSGGSASICGFDVMGQPEQAKRRVGYLPEVPPLHESMRVEAFLRFAATIKGVSSPKSATEKAMERTGLVEHRRKIISTLSKGMRQRVGIAQALIHDPEVLILDEPASGLDPAQREEIRGLIRELAESGRAVILSTHLLWEAEELCDRVIVLHQGKVAAVERMGELTVVRVTLASCDDEARRTLVELNGGVAPNETSPGSFDLPEHLDRGEIARRLAPHGIQELLRVNLLQERFLSITGIAGGGVR